MKKYLKLLGFVAGVGLVVFLMTREFDLEKMIEAGGLLIIGATVFAETGLLIGFFLPGDTLLFAAGFFAAGGALNIYTTILVIIIAAIFGNMAGYEIGRRSGKYVFRKDDSIFF
jgi:membrane-associated protein